MTRPIDTRSNYYVYVLFDWLGVPRYVGKGRGNRWLQHEQTSDPNNWLKNEFIEQTWIAIGEVPKLKVREGISEADAFETEGALIKAIGRFPNGPLVNLTDKRNGPSSERITRWHASRSPEERSASARKGVARMTWDQLSARGKKNALSVGREVLAERMRAWQASLSPEQRRANALLAVAARKPRLKKQIQIKDKPTAAQRSAWASNAAKALHASRSPAERREMARRAGLRGAAVLTPEQRSAGSRKRATSISKERLSAIGRIAGLASSVARKARKARLMDANSKLPPPESPILDSD